MGHPFDQSIFDLVTETPANPAAGTYGSLPVPNGARIQALSISCLYTASAVVVDRLPYAYIYSGAKVIQLALTKSLITASEAVELHFAIGIAGEDLVATHDKQYAALPDEMLAVEGDVVRINAYGLSALDQISDLVFRTKQWVSES